MRGAESVEKCNGVLKIDIAHNSSKNECKAEEIKDKTKGSVLDVCCAKGVYL